MHELGLSFGRYAVHRPQKAYTPTLIQIGWIVDWLYVLAPKSSALRIAAQKFPGPLSQ